MPLFRLPITCIRVLGAFILAAGCFASPAGAQIGESTGLVDALHPEYFNRDIVIFVDGLGLDDTQRVIVEAMFDDYLAGFDEAHALMNEHFGQMQERIQDVTDKAAIVRTALEPLMALIDSKADLKDQLFSSVQVVLTEEQLLQWPSFLRRLTREKSMSKGRLEGESLDLFHVLRDMRLPEAVELPLQTLLQQYETDLDEALKIRNDLSRRSQKDLLSSIAEQGQVTDTSAAERQIHLRVAIRDINDAYRERIAQALGSEYGPTFRQMALERAYPTVFKRTMLQGVIVDALNLHDLSAASREIIITIQLGYEAELEALNMGFLEERRAAEPRELLNRIAQFKERISGQKPAPTPRPQRQNMYRRDDITQPYMISLRAALTDEQFEALPKARRMLERQQRLERMRDIEQASLERGKGPALRSGTAGIPQQPRAGTEGEETTGEEPPPRR